MTYWEPIATPGSHLEPPDPVEWICDVCDLDEYDCECGTCEACGNGGEVTKMKSGDEILDLCGKCKEEEEV